MTQIVIVSGPPGAGKSSACEALCERYDRTVHLQTDDVFGWIRMGFRSPWKPGSNDQNIAVSRACARAATSFVQARYGVFIDGVIGAHLLLVYVEELRVAEVPVHYAIVRPSLETAKSRANARDRRLDHIELALWENVYGMFAQPPAAGVLIDNTGLTADQVADRIMEACGSGEALLWAPG